MSRGRWEGETLVVETAQYRNWREPRTIEPEPGNSSSGSPGINADRVAYEYTVTDPTVYTAPHTVLMPFRRTDGPLFEYACHEGNIGLYGILAGARELERQGRELRP